MLFLGLVNRKMCQRLANTLSKIPIQQSSSGHHYFPMRKMSASRGPNAEETENFLILNSDDEDVEVIADLEGEQEDDLDEDEDAEGGEEDDDEDMDDFPVTVFTPSRNDALLFFRGHTDLVFNVELSPSGRFAVSGGKDDRGWLWKAEDGSPILELTGFKDSVPYVGFSHDEKFVMAADMAGNINVWEVSTKEIVFSTEVGDITWTEWHTSSAILFAGTQDGSISMWLIPSGNMKLLNSFGETTTSVKLLPDGRHLLAGYGDGSVRLWDLKTCQIITTIWKLHQGEVLSIDVNSSGIVASGGADGLKFASLATAFSKGTQIYLAAGSLDGILLIWDVSAGRQRHRIQFGSRSGICRLLWAGPNHVVAASLDGKIREVDARSGEVIKEWEGHTSSILGLSVRGEKLATAAEDRTVGIFQGVVI
ncbi:angio-associated migratory cell protein-like isoform X2 [Varroa destructor]|uniref:Uncharacterized protein n=1 Tax=Varroa destructor TaxID=109461 RepID=A0A7M7MED8_VARDE|nr:angio-associated migratory cell protein-like isoform X2 [Varroa destructor]